MLEDQDDAELMSLATGQSLSLSSGLVSQQYHQQQQHQETLNDSLLAQLTQQELDSALETDVQLHDDWLLAHDLEKEQQKLKEEQEFRKLQVVFRLKFWKSFMLQASHFELQMRIIVVLLKCMKLLYTLDICYSFLEI